MDAHEYVWLALLYMLMSIPACRTTWAFANAQVGWMLARASARTADNNQRGSGLGANKLVLHIRVDGPMDVSVNINIRFDVGATVDSPVNVCS